MRAMLAHFGKECADLMPAGTDLYDYLAAADAMICIGSMIAFEAMALGVMPIVFENPGTYAATSLAEYAGHLTVVHSNSELRLALRNVVDSAPSRSFRESSSSAVVKAVLGDVLSPPAPLLTAALKAYPVDQERHSVLSGRG